MTGGAKLRLSGGTTLKKGTESSGYLGIAVQETDISKLTNAKAVAEVLACHLERSGALQKVTKQNPRRSQSDANYMITRTGNNTIILMRGLMMKCDISLNLL